MNGGSGGGGNSERSKGAGQAAASAGDRWALAQLSSSGEEVLGVLACPQYLLLALTLLLPPLGAPLTFNPSMHLSHLPQKALL